MSDVSGNESTRSFLQIVFSAAFSIGVLLLLLLILFGLPAGKWSERPEGAYAFLWAFLVTGEGILFGLFVCGCAQLLTPHDSSIVINRPSAVITLFGGGMALFGMWRVLVLLGVAIGLFSHGDVKSLAERDKSVREKAIAKDKERQQVRQLALQAESERAGRELVDYFAAGGSWNTEVVPLNDERLELAEPASSSGSVPGSAQPPRQFGSASVPPPPKIIILVIGPADLCTKAVPIRFGLATTTSETVFPQTAFSPLGPSSDPFVRDIYINCLATAIDQKAIAAAIIEVEHPQAESSQGSAAGSGAGLGPARAGGDKTAAASPFDRPEGTLLPLEDARPLSSAEFKKWVLRIVDR